MTFYEAAIEILRRESRPLHYKKITELAIKQDLLSHIGKTPEITMHARLNQEAQKAPATAIARVRPGVFALVEGVEPESVKETVTSPMDMDSIESESGQSRSESGGVPRRSGEGERMERDVTRKRRVGRLDTLDMLVDRAATALDASSAPMRARELAAAVSQVGLQSIAGVGIERLLEQENQRRRHRGERPLFTRHGEGWSLLDGLLDQRTVKRHEDLARLRRSLAEEVTGSLAEQLERISAPARERLLVATLTQLRYEVERLEQTETATTFKAKAINHLVPLTVAVRLYHQAVPIGRDQVATLRGQLQRYRSTHGVLVVPRTDVIEATAREEAADDHGHPITLLDPRLLAPLAVHAGVGVQSYEVAVPLLDISWLSG